MGRNVIEKMDLMRLNTTARRLGVHVDTVRAMIKDGRLRGTKIGKHWRVYRESAETLIAGRKQMP